MGRDNERRTAPERRSTGLGPRALARLRGAVALLGAARTGARAHGAPRIAVARRLVRLRREQGFEFREALAFGLGDPAVPPEVAAGYVSRHVNHGLQRRLNGHDMPPLVGDKLVFQRYCEAHRIPVPALLGVVDRAGAAWTPRGTGAPKATIAPDALPESFVVKPSAGYEGRGVTVVRRDGVRLTPTDGVATDLAGLVARLRAHPEFDAWIVQERLRNHPDLALAVGDATLHTARIVSLVDRSGHAELLWAVLKLGLSGGAVDNFHKGAYGNALASVDVASGSVEHFLVPDGDEGGVRTATALPGGPAADDLRLPDWDDARELVMRAAPRMLPLRTLGWDVALTPDGPVVIEANTRWGAHGSPTMAGVMARLSAVAQGR